MAACGSSEPFHLRLNEIKSDDFCNSKEDNAITCIEFDESGDYLAAGDRAGRVYVFNGSGEEPLYGLFCAFTSHESEFDYLKSLEIEEKINAIMWLPICNNSLQLLTTNDKVIKLWRMSEQSPSVYNFNFPQDPRDNHSGDDECPVSGSSSNSDPSPTSEINNDISSSLKSVASLSSLRIPRYKKRKNLTIEVRSRKIYPNAHTYHINSLSLSSDQETFLSADDLRINLWHVNHTEQSLQFVDIKPENMEDLSEVITCARFHPELCSMLGYSTSRGVVRLCDTRVKAVCDEPTLCLNDPSLAAGFRGFFCDIISSLSDFRFDHSRNCVLARDYLNLKVWDVRKGDRPCEVYSVHDPLRTQLVNLYESDAIFDKFLCSWSYDDRYLFTGSYGNVMRIFDRQQGSDWIYDLGDPEAHPPEPVVTPDNVNVPFPALTPDKPIYRSNRLQPKRFISPDSDVAKHFHLKSLCLANVSSLEAFNNSTLSSPSKVENRPSIDSPVTVGSKRRKQTLLPSEEVERQAQYDEEEEDEGDPNSDDDDEDDFEFLEQEEEEDSKQHIDDIFSGIQHYRHSHRHKVKGASTSSLLPGLQEVDFRKRFLQVAWHPRRGILVGVSGKEMFLTSGGVKASSSGCDVEGSEKLDEEESVLDSGNLDSSLSSQPCPKRPCLREEEEGKGEIAIMQPSPSPSQEFLLIENVTSEEPATDVTSKMDFE